MLKRDVKTNFIIFYLMTLSMTEIGIRTEESDIKVRVFNLVKYCGVISFH